MRTRAVVAAATVAAAIALTGCATGSNTFLGAEGQAATENTVPAGVDISEWRDVQGGGVMSLTPAFMYETLDDLAKASELVIVGKVTEQHPFRGTDMITTESLIEVVEVLKGSPKPGDVRLYTIGTPVYLEQHSNVDGAGDPPLLDRTYVMFLTPVPELTNPEGKLVPMEDVWTATGLGHYVEESDGMWQWDGDNPGGDSGPTPTVTIEAIRAAAQDS